MQSAAVTVVSLMLAIVFPAHPEIVGKAGRFGGNHADIRSCSGSESWYIPSFEEGRPRRYK